MSSSTKTRMLPYGGFLCLTMLVFFSILLAGFAKINFENSENGAVKTCNDFAAYYVAGRMALEGSITDAYHSDKMFEMLKVYCGRAVSMPWTYPPPFDLIAAFLALLPFGLAYFLFITVTFIVYLAILRKLSSSLVDYNIALLACMPSILTTIASGQNGFLTGGLIGCFLFALLKGWKVAGIPLGLLVIKPHLAIGITIFCALEKLWMMLVTAAITAIALSMLATLAFGGEIWSAFIYGMKEAGEFLAAGRIYPFPRMTSIFAASYTLGRSQFAAMFIQLLFASICIFTILFTYCQKWVLRKFAGVVVLLSFGFSPYIYEYDLTSFGMSVALLLPFILGSTAAAEKIILMALSWLFTGYGLFDALAFGNGSLQNGIFEQRVSLGGVAYICLNVLVLRILLRSGATLPRYVEIESDRSLPHQDPGR